LGRELLDKGAGCLHYPPHMFQGESGVRAGAEMLVIAGVIIQYAATRLALAAWTRYDGYWPRRRAVVQWLPICASTLVATAMGQVGVAIGLVFGSAVACLSLVMGLSSCFGGLRELPPNSRLWSLVLPAALLVLLMGFHGSFTFAHGLMLLLMGATFLAVWLERPGIVVGPPLASPTEAPAPPTAPVGATVAAIMLAGLGAWLAIRGTVSTGEHSRMLPADLLAATVLSPLLLLPALGSATTVAQRGQMGQVITALCGTVLLNLCLLLPIVIFADGIHGLLTHPHVSEVTALVGAAAKTTPFPVVTWRVDTVVLVVLGFAMMPVAAGRWLPDRFESVLLIAAYIAYLFVKAIVARSVAV
jgi:Ca2+/Na+ antiporter